VYIYILEFKNIYSTIEISSQVYPKKKKKEIYSHTISDNFP